MRITWHGHSCFQIDTAEGSVVLDPYGPGSVPGLKLPELTADLVLCSHGHRDHGFAQAVTLTGKRPSLRVERLETFHDAQNGALRGTNTVHILEAEGLRVAHLGDLGHLLSPAQLAALGQLDVLLIPVGGHYTIGPEQAAELAEAIHARITVPMHYRGPGFGYEVIGPAEDFLRRRSPVVELEQSCFDPADWAGPVSLRLRCPLAEE